MSSVERWGWASRSSSDVWPDASARMRCSTVIRVPLITGFPAITDGLIVIRFRSSSMPASPKREACYHKLSGRCLPQRLDDLFGHLLGLLHVQDRHAVDRRVGIGLGGRVGHVIGADDEGDVGLRELRVDVLELE